MELVETFGREGGRGCEVFLFEVELECLSILLYAFAFAWALLFENRVDPVISFAVYGVG